MLPDFVRVREPVSEAVTLMLRKLVQQRPLIAAIRKEHFFEGHLWGGSDEQVDEATHSFRRMEVPSEVPTQELIDKGPEALISRLPDLASSMADQLERRMIERLGEVARQEGAVHAGSAHTGMTVDEFLDELRKLEIDFDRDGNAIMPSIVGGPEMLVKLREWESEPEARTKLATLLERKREEFNAREGNRTLVD